MNLHTTILKMVNTLTTFRKGYLKYKECIHLVLTSLQPFLKVVKDN
jgi:hypothetical protein